MAVNALENSEQAIWNFVIISKKLKICFHFHGAHFYHFMPLNI